MLKVRARGAYTLGQEDSISYAKTMAVRDAKRQASEIAGSYIRVKTSVKNGKLREEYIEVLTSSIVSLRILDEGVRLEGKRSLVYYVDAEVIVDKKGVERALGEVLADRRKVRKLQELIRERSALKRELSRVSKELAKVLREKKAYERDIQELKNLISRKDLDIKSRDRLIKKLTAKLDRLERILKKKKHIQSKREELIIRQANIERETVLLFKRGSLLTLAMTTKREKERAFRDVKENFFGYIIRNTDIEVGRVKINPKGDNSADIYVPLRWRIDTDKLTKVLKPYLNFSVRKCEENTFSKRGCPACEGGSFGIVMKIFDNEKEKQKKSYSRELFNFVKSHDVIIEVSVGRYRGHLTIGSAVDCFSYEKDNYSYRLATEGKEGTVLWKYKEQNPVIIKNVPIETLERVDRIKVKVIVRRSS